MRFLFWGSKSKRDSQRALKHATSSDGTGSVKSKTSGSNSNSSNSIMSSKSQTTKQSKYTVGVEQAPVKKEDNKYVKAVKTLMEKLNSYVPEDPDLYAQRILACYASPDTPMIAEDGEQYKASDLAFFCTNICKSLPDFHMTYGKVTYRAKTPKQHKNTYRSKEEDESEEIVAEVELDNLVVSGTHTGAPYTMAPGVLPEIPPSGKFIQNDEERMVFYFNKKGQIVKSLLISLGVHTGPIGVYTLAGGDVSPLFANKK